MVKGILLPRSEGEAPGCIELYDVSEVGVDVTGLLACTDFMDEDDVKAVEERARARLRRTPVTKTVKDGNEETVVLKQAKVSDNSSDDADLDTVWGHSYQNKADQDSDDEGAEDGRPKVVVLVLVLQH
jgi:hypothetical protein